MYTHHHHSYIPSTTVLGDNGAGYSGNYTEQGDTSEVITTMTEVTYYNLHILLCNFSSIDKNLIQGATEVTFHGLNRPRYFYSVIVLLQQYVS